MPCLSFFLRTRTQALAAGASKGPVAQPAPKRPATKPAAAKAAAGGKGAAGAAAGGGGGAAAGGAATASVCVKNVATTATKEELEKVMAEFGAVKNVR